jgi:hypothetical protein
LQNTLHPWYSTLLGPPPDQRNETMVEGVFRQVIEPSKDRSTRSTSPNLDSEIPPGAK